MKGCEYSVGKYVFVRDLAELKSLRNIYTYEREIRTYIIKSAQFMVNLLDLMLKLLDLVGVKLP